MVAPRLWTMLEQIGFLPREQLTWAKASNPEDIVTSTAWGSWCSASNPVLRAVAEPVFIASKATDSRPPGLSDVTPEQFKAWTRNLWTIPSAHVDGVLDHPCKFPPELPRRLIKLYSYVGDVVLDPFCGSGTTLKDLARRAIGVELSSRYCAMTADRCRQHFCSARKQCFWPRQSRTESDDVEPIVRRTAPGVCVVRATRTTPEQGTIQTSKDGG